MDRAFSSGASGTPPSAPGSPSTGYATGGNPGTGTPATKPGAYWYHMITEELRALIVAAGLTPDHTNTSQIAQAVQALIAAGAANDYKASVRAATTANIATLAGGAPNTLDGVALAANDRILVKDQTTGSQNGIYVVTTLGTGANGTWSRASDADQAGELTPGAVVMVEEGTTLADSLWELSTDGTITIGTTALTFVRNSSSSAASIQGAFKNLQVSATGTTSAVAVTADAVALKNASNQYVTLYNISLASLVTGNASGAANSLDTGAWAFSTWYYVYVIWNGTTVAGLFSLSATAPTLPSGYTHFARVGAIRTQSATNYNALAFKQYGRRSQYVMGAGTNVTAPPVMASGAAGTINSTLVSIATGSFVPPTAKRIQILVQHQGGSSGAIQVGPNSSPSSLGGNCLLASLTASNNVLLPYEFNLESSNIYWANNSVVGTVSCIGWDDNL